MGSGVLGGGRSDAAGDSGAGNVRTRVDTASGASDQPGSALIALSASTVVAVAVGNVLPPDPRWLPVLLAALLTATALGLRRSHWVWWVAAGISLGTAACAWAPRAPGSMAGRSLPVRFTLVVRDGWRAGSWGWTTRVRIADVETAGSPLATARELRLTLSGSVTPAELPSPGSRWQGSGELRFDETLPLRRPWLRVKSPLLLRPLPRPAAVDAVREAALRALYRAADVDVDRLRAAGLAAALALGRSELLGAGEVAALRSSGLAHLLAVSGLHVGLVAALVWGALLLAGVRPSHRRWILIGAVLAFALLAGSAPPVRRAASAGIAYLLARQLGRPLEPLPVVWAVIAGLSLWEPDAVTQAGFQLSALVTLALVRWLQPLSARLSALPRPLANALGVALVAQAAAMPLVGTHFGRVPLLGVLANLVAAPLTFALTATSLLAVVAAGVWPLLGGWLLELLALPQGVLDALAGAVRGANVAFAPVPGWVVALAVAVALGALVRCRASWVAAGLIPLATIAWVVWPRGLDRGVHEIRMLGVADGMSVLLRSRGSSVLVDAGRSPSEAGRLLAAAGVRRLDGLLVTHTDTDHTGGAIRVLEVVRVSRLLFPAIAAGTGEMVELRRVARAVGTREVPVAPGQRHALANIDCQILWPPLGLSGSDNNASLVAALSFGGTRVLITGDLEWEGELGLLATGAPLTAAVLQLPHHGSATSSSASFLAAVDPHVALVACGRRPRYSYPNPGVVQRVRRVPALVVSQSAGLEQVWWRDGGDMVVAASRPVTVPGRGRGR